MEEFLWSLRSKPLMLQHTWATLNFMQHYLFLCLCGVLGFIIGFGGLCELFVLKDLVDMPIFNSFRRTGSIS